MYRTTCPRALPAREQRGVKKEIPIHDIYVVVLSLRKSTSLSSNRFVWLQLYTTLWSQHFYVPLFGSTRAGRDSVTVKDGFAADFLTGPLPAATGY